MAPIDPDEAKKAQQLRDAIALQQSYKKSGSFKATNNNSFGQGRSSSGNPGYNHRAYNAPPTPAPTPPSRELGTRHQRPGNETPRRSTPRGPVGTQGQGPFPIPLRNPETALRTQKATSDEKKRKMDSQAADFFDPRPNNAPERGRVQYYQGQDRAAPATTNPASTTTGNVNQPANAHGAPGMPTNTPQRAASTGGPGLSLIDTSPEQAMAGNRGFHPMNPTMFQNTNTAAATTNTVGSATSLLQSLQQSAPSQVRMPLANATAAATNALGGTASNQAPRVPIRQYYQDLTSQPEPLAKDIDMMDVDDVQHRNEANNCTCANHPASSGKAGLSGSRWAEPDPNCPEHGERALKAVFGDDFVGNARNDYRRRRGGGNGRGGRGNGYGGNSNSYSGHDNHGSGAGYGATSWF
ncbi:hypothetical protein GE09DRAFT_1217517 [Coniochaeta sp. 2T2.1]|nr:hypothetical protein GE09DRAFT_1217517 [Coniochaeta sp. 2T2.1]